MISNTDVRSLQTLDLWLESVDTMEIHPLFDRVSREFQVPIITDTDWTNQPDLIQQVAQHQNFKKLEESLAIVDVAGLLKYAWKSHDIKVASKVYIKVVSREWTPFTAFPDPALIKILLEFLVFMPVNAAVFTRICPWSGLPSEIRQQMIRSVKQILESMMCCTNVMENLILRSFEAVFREKTEVSIVLIQDIIEKVSLQVRSPELSVELFLQVFEPLDA